MLKISTHEATKGFACRTRARLSMLVERAGTRLEGGAQPTLRRQSLQVENDSRGYGGLLLTEVSAQRRRPVPGVRAINAGTDFRNYGRCHRS
jgi:hypothetical protein